MLHDRYPLATLVDLFAKTPATAPFPPAADRAAWNALQEDPANQRRRAWLVGRAEGLLTQPWPELSAALYMEYIRIGDRRRYETPYFERRNRLGMFAVAEAFEGKGRFLDAVIEGLWLILGEASWSIPAHARHLPGDPLPHPDLHSVDLFACETAHSVASAVHLLRAELTAAVPGLVQRVDREIEQRVVIPVETYEDLWWFGGKNNWTPWCACNTLGAAMLTPATSGAARIAALVNRLNGPIERFIDTYGEDGGCDEGPGYWNVAAGALLGYLELLHHRSGGAIDIYGEPRIAAMGRFILSAYLDRGWSINFADAHARCIPRRSVAWRYGERTGQPAIQDLVVHSMHGWPAGIPATSPDAAASGDDATSSFTTGAAVQGLPRVSGYYSAQFLQWGTGSFMIDALRELFWMPGEPELRPLPMDKTTWLPDLQVLIARQSSNPAPGSGFILAAKAGHNAENHNHNDVGHFIIFHDGHPVIVDIGVEAYSRKTFSKDRYTIWCMRGSGHNAPVINHVEQMDGRQYAASDVTCEADDEHVRLQMDLQHAYPTTAGVASLQRLFHFDRTAGSITVTDTFDVAQTPAILEMSLYTPANVALLRDGLIEFTLPTGRVHLQFPENTWNVDLNPVQIDDDGLRKTWGKLTHLAFRGSIYYRDLVSALRFVAADPA